MHQVLTYDTERWGIGLVVARLPALVPRLRMNLTHNYGVLAPNRRWKSQTKGEFDSRASNLKVSIWLYLQLNNSGYNFPRRTTDRNTAALAGNGR